MIIVFFGNPVGKLQATFAAGMKENTYEDTDPADARTVDVTNLSQITCMFPFKITRSIVVISF